MKLEIMEDNTGCPLGCTLVVDGETIFECVSKQDLLDMSLSEILDLVAELKAIDVEETKEEETKETPSVKTLRWMAAVMARNLRCFANDAMEYGFTEEEEQNLRNIADRLDAGTATDTDWKEAMFHLDING